MSKYWDIIRVIWVWILLEQLQEQLAGQERGSWHFVASEFTYHCLELDIGINSWTFQQHSKLLSTTVLQPSLFWPKSTVSFTRIISKWLPVISFFSNHVSCIVLRSCGNTTVFAHFKIQNNSIQLLMEKHVGRFVNLIKNLFPDLYNLSSIWYCTDLHRSEIEIYVY